MRRRISVIAALAGALFITACDRAEDLGVVKNDCNVQLYVSADPFDYTKPHDVVVEGKYSNLRSLPLANIDWSNRVGSVAVGQKAELQVWEKENFQGTTTTYQAGTTKSNIDKFNSMQVTCKQ